MELTFKQGQPEDLNIVYGKGISDSPLGLIDLCKANRISCEYSSAIPDRTIKFYINPVKTRKPSKKKVTAAGAMSQPVKVSSKSKSQTLKTGSNSFSDLLAKYNGGYNSQPISKKPFEDSGVYSQSENLVLKLIVVYIREKEVEDYLKTISSKIKTEVKGAKHIFVLEGIKSAVKGRSYQTKKKLFSKENSNSQLMAFHSQIDLEDYGNITGGDVIETLEDLDLKLMDMTSHTSWEYEFTQTPEESLLFIQKLAIAVVNSKYKVEAGEFDVKGQTHSTESNYAGVTDAYSLMWIDMLMAVPGVSEKKALAIYQQYPSLPKLMKAYDNQPDELSKMKMMAEIPVNKTFDTKSKARNLGKALSNKIYAVFQCEKDNRMMLEDDPDI